MTTETPTAESLAAWLCEEAGDNRAMADAAPALAPELLRCATMADQSAALLREQARRIEACEAELADWENRLRMGNGATDDLLNAGKKIGLRWATDRLRLALSRTPDAP